ncbi:transmembrane protein, putative [Medicago truncatula]|uniref:Transmembrane protein, putative n=1 Tax=Medicago truncatula TaxID=3880 RepID=G7ICZ0_MEDTR|nr:transmembrane protein, putative [Medicago truncatula]
MIWTSTLQIQKQEYSSDLDYIILFVGILPFYAINLGAACSYKGVLLPCWL